MPKSLVLAWFAEQRPACFRRQDMSRQVQQSPADSQNVTDWHWKSEHQLLRVMSRPFHLSLWISIESGKWRFEGVLWTSAKGLAGAPDPALFNFAHLGWSNFRRSVGKCPVSFCVLGSSPSELLWAWVKIRSNTSHYRKAIAAARNIFVGRQEKKA